MTDLLKERISDAEWKYGNVSIEHVGKTAGVWFNDEVPYTWSFERNSLSTYVKKHPECESIENRYWLPDNYRVIIGKEYGYTARCSSRKRYEYAIIKINQ